MHTFSFALFLIPQIFLMLHFLFERHSCPTFFAESQRHLNEASNVLASLAYYWLPLIIGQQLFPAAQTKNWSFWTGIFVELVRDKSEILCVVLPSCQQAGVFAEARQAGVSRGKLNCNSISFYSHSLPLRRCYLSNYCPIDIVSNFRLNDTTTVPVWGHKKYSLRVLSLIPWVRSGDASGVKSYW